MISIQIVVPRVVEGSLLDYSRISYYIFNLWKGLKIEYIVKTTNSTPITMD